MKKNLSVYLFSMLMWTSIAFARNNQSTNPFDAAIRQIDAQSKEINQQIISTQQDRLVTQKAQKFEHELAAIKTELVQERATIKTHYDEQINALKNEVANAQEA